MKNKKLRHQVKSRWYYIFWGIATVSVVSGQVYVGSGFRTMSNYVNQVLEKLNEVPSSSS
jgi:hypothetical protein